MSICIVDSCRKEGEAGGEANSLRQYSQQTSMTKNASTCDIELGRVNLSDALFYDLCRPRSWRCLVQLVQQGNGPLGTPLRKLVDARPTCMCVDPHCPQNVCVLGRMPLVGMRTAAGTHHLISLISLLVREHRL